MFEPLSKSGDSHIRTRRVALLLGAASLILFIASYAWYEIQATEHRDSLCPYWWGELDAGLAWGAILGAMLAAGLFLYSLVLEKRNSQ